MVGKMVQNSQNLYSFTFTAVIVIHEYIYSHATTTFTFKKYICLHLTIYFVFKNIIIYSHLRMHHSHSTAYICSHSQSKYSFNRGRKSRTAPLKVCRYTVGQLSAGNIPTVNQQQTEDDAMGLRGDWSLKKPKQYGELK